jgi:basic membrane protein A
MRNFAYEGYDLVIAHDFNYNDIVSEVAPEFPDVIFTVSYGFQSSEDNIAAITSSGWHPSYMAGVLAAAVTETNKVGVVSATDSYMGKKMRGGFVDGAKSVNPDVEVMEAFTGSWDDVVKGKELANGMIQQGVDVILANSGNVNIGIIETAKEAGILAIGAPSDLSSVAPETVIASAITDSGIFVDYGIRQLVEDNFAGGVYVLGIKEGAEGLIWNPAFEAEFPAEVIETVEAAKMQLSNGEIEAPVVE